MGLNYFGANNFTHKISLKNKAPVYVPQYRLADTHKQALDKQDLLFATSLVRLSKTKEFLAFKTL